MTVTSPVGSFELEMLPERIGVDTNSRLRVTYTRKSPGRAYGLTCVLEPN